MPVKALYKYSDNEKGWWRKYKNDPKNFFEKAGLSHNVPTSFRVAEFAGYDLESYLNKTPERNVKLVKWILEENADAYYDMDWTLLGFFEWTREVERTVWTRDNLIFCWIKVMDIEDEVSEDHILEYEFLFRDLLVKSEYDEEMPIRKR